MHKRIALVLLFGSLTVPAFGSQCPKGEKRLRESEPCLPASLFNYLYCLEKSGGGTVEFRLTENSDKQKQYEINIGGKASGVIVKGEGTGGIKVQDTTKVATEINKKLDPKLADNCRALAKSAPAAAANPPAPNPTSRTKTFATDSAILSVKYSRRYMGEPEFWVAQTNKGEILIVDSVSNRLLRRAKCADTMAKGFAITRAPLKQFVGVLCSFKIRMFSIDRESDDFTLDPSPAVSAGYTNDQTVASALNSFFTAGIGSCALRWNLSAKSISEKLQCESRVRFVSLDETGGRILTATDDTVSLWAIGLPEFERRWETKLKSDSNPTGTATAGSNNIHKIALSRDGKLAIAATNGPSAFLIDAGLATIRHVSHHPSAIVTDAELDRSGEMLATGSSDGKIAVWQTKDSRRLWLFEHDEPVSKLAFSPDGRFLISNSDDRSTRVWSLETGKETSRINHERSCAALDVQTKDDGVYVLVGTGRRYRHQNEVTGTFFVREWKLTASGKLVAQGST